MVSLLHRATINYSLEVGPKDVLPNINRTQAAERAKNAVFVFGDLDLWHLTLTFELVRARDQASLPYEFGANRFSGSRYISYTNKKPHTDGAKNRNFRSSLRSVIKKNEQRQSLMVAIVLRRPGVSPN